MNDKKEYIAPELEIIEFETEDIITTSDTQNGGTYELPRI